MKMAAISRWAKFSRNLSHIFHGVTPCHSFSVQTWRPFQLNLTWCQLKYFYSQSGFTLPRYSNCQQDSSRSGWHWLVLLATAGFSQGFLGFSFGKKEEEKKGDPLLNVFRDAKEAQIKQDFKKAEIIYHDALRVADEMLKLKKINSRTYIYAKTNIYDSLADMALAQGELEKAEGLYKETMKGCLQQGLSQDDNAIIELSIKLSSIYAMLDRRSDAEQGLLFCIKSQEAKISSSKPVTDTVSVPDKVLAKEGKDDGKQTPDSEVDEEEKRREDTEALLGMALETYGRFLMGQRRLSEAVPVLEQALGVGERVLGTDKEQYVILLNDLATVHILLKHFDQATDILNKAIQCAVGIQSSYLPVLYCNLGAIFLRTSKLDDAEIACLKGQELSNKGKQTMAFSMSQKCLEKISQARKSNVQQKIA